MSAGQESGDDFVPHLEEAAGTVLGVVNECFDLLLRDIVDAYVLPIAEERFVRKYLDGASRVYFPFKRATLEDKKSALYLLQGRHKYLYDQLYGFAASVENGWTVGETLLRANNFAIIREMVNDKKHDGSIEYRATKGDKTLVMDGNSQFVFDGEYRNTEPEFFLRLSKDATARMVGTYRFVGLGIEVFDLCRFATGATRYVMEMFYSRFFHDDGLRLWQPLKVTITEVEVPLSERLNPASAMVKLNPRG